MQLIKKNAIADSLYAHYDIFLGGLFGSALVILTLEDANDNAPIFYPAAYNVTVRRDASPGTPILIVSAHDLDEGQFGAITYGISAGNEAAKFRIDKTSGNLKTASESGLIANPDQWKFENLKYRDVETCRTSQEACPS